MKLQRAFFMLLLSTLALFATPNTAWKQENVFIEINKKLLNGDAHLLKNLTKLQNVYRSRQNRPLWLTRRGIKGKKVMQLFASIQKDVTLDPRSFINKNAKKLKKDLERRHTRASILRFDVELTMLYYDFLQHTIYGEIDWKAFDAHLTKKQAEGIDNNWVRYPLYFDILSLMSKENIIQTLREITPHGYQYHKLTSALYRLYKIKWQGGWAKIPAVAPLKKGQSNPVVPQLRKRLTISGDYRDCSTQTSSNYFDTCLENAIKHFQKRHNTVADGVVGRGTQKLLNISLNSKINKLLLNIDRIKWLPRKTTERHIVVNIPEYMLHYYEYGREQKHLKVIIGKPTHPTPVFSDMLSYITINPYWKLPPGIIKKEVVPAMIENPNYIKNHGLEAHETWEENSSVVSLTNINWSMYLSGETKFPYRLMQPPGPKNALGKIKFKFPNKFSVYLHDTPSRYLFNKKKRAFSHGCVRLSQPFSLLESLSKNEPYINSSEVQTLLATKKKKEIDLTKDIPIHLVYLTTWVDEYNQPVFGDDIYEYDKYQQRVIR